MPRLLTLDQAEVTGTGGIGIQLGLRYVDEDGDEISATALRRMVDPNGDLDQNIDDLNGYLATNKYPAISDASVTLLHAIDTAARANPEIEAARAKWIEDHPPTPVVEQPEPTEQPPTP